MVIPQRLFLQVLDDYEQSRGNTSIIKYWRDVRITLGSILISMTIAEIILYAIFFYHMYQHDNDERLRRLLEPSIIQRRNKQNAVTFFGQFCSFVFEISFCIAGICAVRGDASYFVIFLLQTMCFTCMSIVEVLTSSSLRPRIFKF